MGKMSSAVRCQRVRNLNVLVILIAACSIAAPRGFAQTMNSGWRWPTGSSNFCGYLGWLGSNPGWGFHLAQDMCNGAGRPVYSVGDGEVISSGLHGAYGCNGSCSGGALLARYQAADGTWFTALYGHLDNWHGTGHVNAGDVLGYTRSDWTPPHLHFAVHQGFDPEPSDPWRGYTSSTSTTYGFTDPIPFLSAHPTQPVQVTEFFQKNANGQYTISCPTDNLVDAQFKLLNSGPTALTFSQVAMALHRESDDAFVTDVAPLQYGVTVPAGGTYQFPRSFLDGTNSSLQPGTYRLVAKVYYASAWVELSNHLPFTILSRSNSCGGSTVTDPLITALANSTQPVRWFYITNQNTGAWYIVSATGEQVMYLDKVDRGTTFGIYWRPVNNSSFTTYPNAGKNFSSVSISSDGRTITFGSAVASPSDPHVSALANTAQPVRWFYITNQNTGAWYIVSAAGQQVMYLDRVDQSTTFGIYWKPINNSSFSGYPAAAQNYSSVTISSDGRTVSFGSSK